MDLGGGSVEGIGSKSVDSLNTQPSTFLTGTTYLAVLEKCCSGDGSLGTGCGVPGLTGLRAAMLPCPGRISEGLFPL